MRQLPPPPGLCWYLCIMPPCKGVSYFAMVSFFPYCLSEAHCPWGNAQALFICIFTLVNTSQKCCVSYIDSGFHLFECGYYLLYFRCQYEWLSSTDRCAFEVAKEKDWHDFWHDFCQDFSMPFAAIPSLMNTFYSSEMCNLMLCYLFSSLISKCQSSVRKLR